MWPYHKRKLVILNVYAMFLSRMSNESLYCLFCHFFDKEGKENLGKMIAEDKSVQNIR